MKIYQQSSSLLLYTERGTSGGKRKESKSYTLASTTVSPIRIWARPSMRVYTNCAFWTHVIYFL